MKFRLFILIVCFLLSYPSFAKRGLATLFVDSSEPSQSALIAEINQALFYSPTLRAAIQVSVFDINPDARRFDGEVTYHQDKEGKVVAQYRPGALPYIFCRIKGQEQMHFTLSDKEQIFLCIENG